MGSPLALVRLVVTTLLIMAGIALPGAAEAAGAAVDPMDEALFAAGSAPVTSDGGPDGAVEVGTTFYSEVAGTIRGVRFYKDPDNVGPHVAHLWAIDGTLLATAPFVNETASGWQEALFATPVAIRANELYVASYHVPQGHYAADTEWRGAISGWLHAPADGTVVDGRPVRNGAFAYGPAGTFPTDAWRATNYWVDVLFRPDELAPDPIEEEPLDYSLLPSGYVPPQPDTGADAPVELGVTFYVDVPGELRSVRFYKSAQNTGTHLAHLWTTDGALLASATFVNETGSGWQEAQFAAPVALVPGALYVASYHTTVGHYAFEPNWPGRNAPPLHAPANGALIDGVYVANGRFGYGPAGTFPSFSWQGSAYGVDVVFRPSAAVPVLQTISVVPGSTDLNIGAHFQLQALGVFSNGATHPISADWSTSAPGVLEVDRSGLATALSGGAALVSASLGGITGTASVQVADLPPDPKRGPGGPILVVAGDGNPFSYYLAEILRGEGMNAFEVASVNDVTSTKLAAYDVVVLGALDITTAQAAMFETWVRAGGNLVAMRPDADLAKLLGLTRLGTTLSEGYLRIDTAMPEGSGLVGQTIQFHGTADRYSLAGATEIARLYASATTATTSPAVTLRSVGAGKAAAFTYDLARSIVLTRQGNPAWSGQHRDGYSQIRSDNLFFGASPGDRQRDWVDFSRIAIPQADEQQRLLANLVVRMNLTKRPLPRFWYLPSFHKAAVVMTGDDHANGGTKQRYEDYLAYSPPGCSVEDWECVRGTSYVFANTPLSLSDALLYDSLGFETALHVSTGCADWPSIGALDLIYDADLENFAASYPGLRPPATNRTHCIIWSDYDSQPRVSLAYGIRLDTNYYYWPASWVQDRPGFMTGSGMPMRFADRSGNLIDVYQAATQMTDESNQTYPSTIDALIDGAIGPSGYYGVFTANIHTDFNPMSQSDAIIRSAQARGVPVITARQLLTWLDGRNASSFRNLRWTSNVLAFDLEAASGVRNLIAMVPLQVGSTTAAFVHRNGVSRSYEVEHIKGIDYLVFDAEAGSYTITYQ